MIVNCVVSPNSQQAALEGQDLPRSYLAHDELEGVDIIIIIIILVILSKRCQRYKRRLNVRQMQQITASQMAQCTVR